MKLNTAVGRRMAKHRGLWSDGVFLEYRAVSGETVVVTKKGAFKARTVQRTPFEHSWGSQSVDQVGGVP